MSDDEIAPEMLARLGTNAIAMLWAQEFNKTAIKIGYSEMDEGWLTSWFANAIENCDMMRRNPLRADLAAVTAERDRLQIMHDEAYISGMKHGWNCCAAGEEERYKNSIENIREQIRRARAALEGVMEPPR